MERSQGLVPLVRVRLERAKAHSPGQSSLGFQPVIFNYRGCLILHIKLDTLIFNGLLCNNKQNITKFGNFLCHLVQLRLEITKSTPLFSLDN